MAHVKCNHNSCKTPATQGIWNKASEEYWRLCEDHANEQWTNYRNTLSRPALSRVVCFPLTKAEQEEIVFVNREKPKHSEVRANRTRLLETERMSADIRKKLADENFWKD